MEKQQRTQAHKKVMKRLLDENLTQKQVADYMGITPQAVNNRLKRNAIAPIMNAINDLSKQELSN